MFNCSIETLMWFGIACFSFGILMHNLFLYIIKKRKDLKFEDIEPIEVIKVPTEVKFKKKDGTVTLKVKKIVRKSKDANSEVEE